MMTRGAVMGLASFKAMENKLSWLGVGNVEGLLLRANPETKPARKRLPLHGGVVGYYLPLLHEHSLMLERGDTLVLTSDGIRSDFEKNLAVEEPPQRLAEHILRHSFKGTDDAQVLVAHYVGENHDDPGH